MPKLSPTEKAELRKKRTQIVTLLVGSRAWGTHVDKSDTDTFTIYVPTQEELKGEAQFPASSGDQSHYSLYDLLRYAVVDGSRTHFAPFFSPVLSRNDNPQISFLWTLAVHELSTIDYISPTLVRGYFGIVRGYWEKFLEEDNWKSAYGALNVLFELHDLLRLRHPNFPSLHAEFLKRVRFGQLEKKEVLAVFNRLYDTLPKTKLVRESTVKENFDAFVLQHLTV